MFLACKEAITNVVRHAQASAAYVRLHLSHGSFTFEIEDNGRGPVEINSERAKTRSGLKNLRKRMEEVGGQFELRPGPEKGTVVRLTAPLNAPRKGKSSRL